MAKDVVDDDVPPNVANTAHGCARLHERDHHVVAPAPRRDPVKDLGGVSSDDGSPGGEPLPVRQSEALPKEQEATAHLAINFRLSADKEIIRLLRLEGRQSRVASDFELECRDAGVGGLLKLYKDRHLFRALVRMKIYVPEVPPPGFHSAIGGLVHIAVYSQVPEFIENYIFRDGWNATKGTLKTCLINGCLCSFAREYRHYCREEGHARSFPTDDDSDLEADSREGRSREGAGADEQLFSEAHHSHILQCPGLTPEDKIILIRIAQGFTQREVAEELGMTVSAINSRIRRAKEKITDWLRKDG